jgi:predicted nucleic acid-binding protein
MNMFLDADVLAYGLRVPKDKRLMHLHQRSKKLIQSLAAGDNGLFLPFPTLVEIASLLARLESPSFAWRAVRLISQRAQEILGCSFMPREFLMNLPEVLTYFSESIVKAIEHSKTTKDTADNWVPGYKSSPGSVLIGGMDIFVLSYIQLRELNLITNDWSLWYVAWKLGVNAYWLSGLTNIQADEITSGVSVVYPSRAH